MLFVTIWTLAMHEELLSNFLFKKENIFHLDNPKIYQIFTLILWKFPLNKESPPLLQYPSNFFSKSVIYGLIRIEE